MTSVIACLIAGVALLAAAKDCNQDHGASAPHPTASSSTTPPSARASPPVTGVSPGKYVIATQSTYNPGGGATRLRLDVDSNQEGNGCGLISSMVPNASPTEVWVFEPARDPNTFKIVSLD